MVFVIGVTFQKKGFYRVETVLGMRQGFGIRFFNGLCRGLVVQVDGSRVTKRTSCKVVIGVYKGLQQGVDLG